MIMTLFRVNESEYDFVCKLNKYILKKTPNVSERNLLLLSHMFEFFSFTVAHCENSNYSAFITCSRNTCTSSLN